MKKGFPASSLYTNKFPDAAWVHRQKSDQSGLKGGGGGGCSWSGTKNVTKQKVNPLLGMGLHCMRFVNKTFISFCCLSNKEISHIDPAS